MSTNDLLMQAIGELREANKIIAEAMSDIKTNLKTLNDYNILHIERTDNQHNSITKQLEVMTTKYWWLIIALLVVLLLVLGYKEAIKFLV